MRRRLLIFAACVAGAGVVSATAGYGALRARPSPAAGAVFSYYDYEGDGVRLGRVDALLVRYYTLSKASNYTTEAFAESGGLLGNRSPRRLRERGRAMDPGHVFVIVGGWPLGVVAEDDRTIGRVPWNAPRGAGRGPVRVLWGGLAANALLLGAAASILLLAPGRVRRVVRRRRGACLACGYDVRTLESERCPECGTVRRASVAGVASPERSSARASRSPGAPPPTPST